MKTHQLLGLGIIAAALFVLFMPSVPFIPGPTPEAKALAAELSTKMSGENVRADARVLADILKSTANLLVLDTQRKTPFYADTENFKWVIRNVGDITYPEGWIMSQKYPGLPELLAGKLQGSLGEDFTREKLVEELRRLANGFAAV